MIRATNVMIAGKSRVVCGYGGRQGRAMRAGHGAHVIVCEVDPICALEAVMDGFEVRTLEDAVETADIFISVTGNRDVITAGEMSTDEERRDRRQHRPLRQRDRQRVEPRRRTESTSSRRSTRGAFPDGHAIFLLAEGRLVNLGNARATRRRDVT